VLRLTAQFKWVIAVQMIHSMQNWLPWTMRYLYSFVVCKKQIKFDLCGVVEHVQYCASSTCVVAHCHCVAYVVGQRSNSVAAQSAVRLALTRANRTRSTKYVVVLVVKRHRCVVWRVFWCRIDAVRGRTRLRIVQIQSTSIFDIGTILLTLSDTHTTSLIFLTSHLYL